MLSQPTSTKRQLDPEKVSYRERHVNTIIGAFHKFKLALNHHCSPDMIGWVSVGILSVLCYLYLSNVFTGQNLHVWGDEITYSIDSRLDDLALARYPNLLYLKLFSLAGIAGTGFLELARSLNAALIAISVPFVYAISRRYCSRRLSLLVAFLSVLGPITTYAAYFMPDAMYFSVFYGVAWFCLSSSGRRPVIEGLVAGVLFACLASVKPHGAFVLAAFLMMQLVLILHQRNVPAIVKGLKVSGVAIVAFASMHVFLGFIFTGTGDAGLIGGYSQFTSVPWGGDQYLYAAKLAVMLLQGHFTAVALLVGVAILGVLTTHDGADEERRIALRRLRTFVACLMVLMVLVTVAFSVRIADGAPFVDTMRLHMRYYNLFFPLLYIVAASCISTEQRPSWVLRGLGALLAVTAITSMFGSLDRFIPTELDAPELRGIAVSSGLLCVVAALSAVSITAFLIRPMYGARLYLFIALPVMLMMGSINVNEDLRGRLTDMTGDKAGKIVKTFLQDDARHIGFFGDVVAICQAQFYAGDSTSFLYLLSEGEPVPASLVPGLPVDGHLIPPGKTMPPDTRWLVVFGKRPIPDNYTTVLDFPEWSLLQRESD
ncbi:hypothetical protein BFW86_20705 [Pseudomonas fluorescens]|nr:hypothetical protein BFW86_20705 [Pseudomonas fluorescens]